MRIHVRVAMFAELAGCKHNCMQAALRLFSSQTETANYGYNGRAENRYDRMYSDVRNTIAISRLTSAIAVLRETLESRGVLGQLRAQIRAEVYKALDDQVG